MHDYLYILHEKHSYKTEEQINQIHNTPLVSHLKWFIPCTDINVHVVRTVKIIGLNV